MRWFAVCAAAALIGGAAHAQVSSTVNSVSHQMLTGDPTRIVCHTEDVTGSRLGAHKVCKTASQWADDERETKLFVDRSTQNKPTYCAPGRPC